MTFLWPAGLAALLLVPAAVIAYVVLQRRRAGQAAARAATGLVTVGTPAALGRRRHVPFALLLVGAAVLAVGLARPQVAIAVPKLSGTVVLGIDVSNSMAADDVAPTRLEAAKKAARAFVAEQPDGVSIALVAFSTGAQLVVRPTQDRAEVLAAIDRLTTGGDTELGSALLTAMNAIVDTPIQVTADQLDAGDLSGIDVGFHPSTAIVLASDGESTGGPDPILIADLPAAAGVRVTTIGIGSTDGAVIDVDGVQVSTLLDEETLTGVAAATNGTYHRATDAQSLEAVYKDLDLQWVAEPEETEVTGLFATGAVLVLLGAALASMRWLGRVV